EKREVSKKIDEACMRSRSRRRWALRAFAVRRRRLMPLYQTADVIAHVVHLDEKALHQLVAGQLSLREARQRLALEAGQLVAQLNEVRQAAQLLALDAGGGFLDEGDAADVLVEALVLQEAIALLEPLPEDEQAGGGGGEDGEGLVRGVHHHAGHDRRIALEI